MTPRRARQIAMDWFIEPMLLGVGSAFATILWVFILGAGSGHASDFMVLIPLVLGPITMYGLAIAKIIWWPRLKRRFLGSWLA